MTLVVEEVLRAECKGCAGIEVDLKKIGGSELIF